MAIKYNVTELNTSIKPFVFSYLFDKYPDEAIVYFDPDIFVYSRLVELENCLNDGAECVLTPHLCEPAEFAHMDDMKFLTYGIYNLGFCAFRNSEQTRRVIEWWARRLTEHCVIDRSAGLFVDQKWADYFPAFVDNTHILRHRGYNVAYWNLAERPLTIEGKQWHSNGQPLRFFHFSGNNISIKNVFTRHSEQFTPFNNPELRKLLIEYSKEVYNHGHSYFCRIQFGFSWLGLQGKNEHAPMPLAENERAAKPYLPVQRFNSIETFIASRKVNAEQLHARFNLEKALVRNNEPFRLRGFCSVCNKIQYFNVSQLYSTGSYDNGIGTPNWRESLDCVCCGFINRLRGAIHVFDQCFGDVKYERVYITENVTPLFTHLKKRWPSLVGSEYLSSEFRPGQIVNYIRHEDLNNLSFKSDSFDLILSFDVMEHVADRQLAFEEIYRCLDRGGRFLFTAPFSHDHRDEVVRAVRNTDGSLLHFMEPEYHGNPVDQDNGSFCYRDFGWSVLAHLTAAGFRNAEVICFWSEQLLHFGDPQIVISCEK